ncbi:ABC transporter ATP-binding protein [Desulfosarcina ovata]|uniref:ABC transporter ATP-binding protein n=1 Tax=Desulfosarcina ovata subsp. ovata TaxID=2752305 RepID=A0A5K8A8X7_9BACT|nr:ATP-binding cassette domain-containing protein [Desulfosarcina ovata]BBO89102.1 ABC transporter ATP-binding protein [Desulfosarcina ovata subsp. ovata]
MIEVKNLTKQFGHHLAVDDISFSADKGEILGFLGPNGAGKSTTMRMITGFFPPTAGTVIIGGSDIQTDSIAARRKIGYLPENAPVYPDMTVSRYLDFCAAIRGFSGADKRQRVGETIERCFLGGVRQQSVSTLSKGYKQRVCFAQSILHDPEYLILDEPTDGLDPNQKHEVRLMIREMSASKVIIFSTHILDEVDTVCNRAIIIAGGKVVADDTPDGLRRRSAFHGSVALTLTGDAIDAAKARLEEMAGVASVSAVAHDGDRCTLRIFPDDPDVPIADRIITAVGDDDGLRIASIFVEQGRLDDVFRDITTG